MVARCLRSAATPPPLSRLPRIASRSALEIIDTFYSTLATVIVATELVTPIHAFGVSQGTTYISSATVGLAVADRQPRAALVAAP
jgi:hypothetical protein